MWLIVGLGNPGPKYELTRHNFGFLAIDFLCDQNHGGDMQKKFSSQCAKISIGNDDCLVMKPETFMNRSGTAVQQAMAFYKISLENIVVIHDEIDLSLGEMRIKKGGGNGGHNGLKDISRLIGPNFFRVRLGVGRPQTKGSEASYVLNNFRNDEISDVEEVLKNCSIAVETLLKEGLEKTQAKCQMKKVKDSKQLQSKPI